MNFIQLYTSTALTLIYYSLNTHTNGPDKFENTLRTMECLKSEESKSWNRRFSLYIRHDLLLYILPHIITVLLFLYICTFRGFLYPSFIHIHTLFHKPLVSLKVLFRPYVVKNSHPDDFSFGVSLRVLEFLPTSDGRTSLFSHPFVSS